MLTRDQILAAAANHQDIEVPEWGGEVRVKAMSAAQFMEYQQIIGSYKDDSKAGIEVAPQICAWCITDADNEPMFTTADLDEITDREVGPVMRLAAAAVKLSTLGMTMDDKAKELLDNPLGDSPTS